MQEKLKGYAEQSADASYEKDQFEQFHDLERFNKSGKNILSSLEVMQRQNSERL